MVRISVPTPAPAHGHRPDCSAPCVLLVQPVLCVSCSLAGAVPVATGGTYLLYSPGTHGSPTAWDPATNCDRPCGEDARPVGRPSKVRNPISVSHLSSYHSASNSSSAPATLGTTGSSSPRSCTSKPTPTSAPGWTPMTLVGEIFLLFARVRLHPFLEKWILLPHDDMPHIHGASCGTVGKYVGARQKYQCTSSINILRPVSWWFLA